MKSIKKIIAAGAAAIMALSMLAGCGGSKGGKTEEKAKAADVTGSYSIVSIAEGDEKYTANDLEKLGLKSGDFSLEIKDGGTFTMTSMGDETKGEWKMDGNKLTMTVDGESVDAAVDGNKLTISEDGLSMVFEK